MHAPIEALQKKRDDLLQELNSFEVFRRGTISVNYRKCGKPSCWCSQEGSRGHGPQYLWTARIGGKNVSKNLHIGPEVEKYVEETERYKKFVDLCNRLVEVNEQLCERRPVRELEDEKDLESLKKKLHRQLLKRQKRR